MKAKYQTPAIEIAKLQTVSGLLIGSPAAGVAGRNDYGNGGSQTW